MDRMAKRGMEGGQNGKAVGDLTWRCTPVGSPTAYSLREQLQRIRIPGGTSSACTSAPVAPPLPAALPVPVKQSPHSRHVREQH